MSYHLRLLPEAKEDIQEFILYYNDQADDLGAKFFRQVVSSMRIISENPKIFQAKFKTIRQISVKGFPVQIHFILKEKKQRVIIIAVLHSSRNPKIWQNRIS